jgi:hypothetical protein
MRCPNGCGHEWSVEHLFAPPLRTSPEYPSRTAGPWYCDECGQGWRLTYSSNAIDVEPYGGDPSGGGDGKARRQIVTLELPPQDVAVRFKVLGKRFTPQIDEGSVRYFYEEHTCPANWMGEVEEVEIGDDKDPHGLWRVISVVDEFTPEARKP